MTVLSFLGGLFAMYLWYLTSDRVKHNAKNKLFHWVAANANITKLAVVIMLLLSLFGFILTSGLLAGIFTFCITTTMSLSLIIGLVPLQLFKRSKSI